MSIAVQTLLAEPALPTAPATQKATAIQKAAATPAKGPPPAGAGRPRTARYAVSLPHTRHAPSFARHVSERWLTETDPGPRVPDAVLVVSELVTNAVRHTRGSCRLTLTVHDGRLDIAVSDHSEELPEVDRRRCGDERGGFGMALIHELGAQITLVPARGGKTVHALLQPWPEPETYEDP